MEGSKRNKYEYQIKTTKIKYFALMMHTHRHNHKIIKCGDNTRKKRQTKGKETPDKFVKVQLITRKSKSNARQPKERETDRDEERNGT